MELLAVPCDHAILAKGRGRQCAFVTPLHGTQCGLEVHLLHQPTGKIATDDEVVDLLEQCVDAVIDFVQISNDRNAGSSRPLRGERGCGGVMTVNVQGAGMRNPLPVEVGGLQEEAFVATAKYGTFAEPRPPG